MGERLVEQWLELVRTAESTSHAVERGLATRHGLCIAAYEILQMLDTMDVAVRLNHVGARVSRSQSRVSRLLAQMVDEGYVTREQSPDDARSARVRITPKGTREFRAATQTVQALLEKSLEDTPKGLRLLTDPASHARSS
ncbi:winged helix DNA-binding protein [Flexivirga sp. ID2601S]|uniref:Winged helix DNA-binding protein n=1 Tax=Flexivirga aerilata TaxID=1656889 RepID=A0A849AGP6_9MICO|nr:winged helix DNA-binding protein [Flexivirga aerilata]